MTQEGSAPRRGWFERLLFTFMGPPQLGDISAPASAVPDAAVLACHRCRQAWTAHEVVRTSSRTYTRCPERPAPE
jgi:hypothetical protein